MMTGEFEPMPPSGSQTDRGYYGRSGGGNSPRRNGLLPPIASPRQKKSAAMLSETKYRKIADKLMKEVAEDTRKQKEAEASKKEESSFTIRNALMKSS